MRTRPCAGRQLRQGTDGGKGRKRYAPPTGVTVLRTAASGRTSAPDQPSLTESRFSAATFRFSWGSATTSYNCTESAGLFGRKGRMSFQRPGLRYLRRGDKRGDLVLDDVGRQEGMSQLVIGSWSSPAARRLKRGARAPLECAGSVALSLQGSAKPIEEEAAATPSRGLRARHVHLGCPWSRRWRSPRCGRRPLARRTGCLRGARRQRRSWRSRPRFYSVRR